MFDLNVLTINCCIQKTVPIYLDNFSHSKYFNKLFALYVLLFASLSKKTYQLACYDFCSCVSDSTSIELEHFYRILNNAATLQI